MFLFFLASRESLGAIKCSFYNNLSTAVAGIDLEPYSHITIFSARGFFRNTNLKAWSKPWLGLRTVPFGLVVEVKSIRHGVNPLLERTQGASICFLFVLRQTDVSFSLPAIPLSYGGCELQTPVHHGGLLFYRYFITPGGTSTA